MKLRYYYNLVRGKTNALNPAKIDWKHIKAVIQAWVRGKKKNPTHIQEQIIWRRTEIIKKSPSCWVAGQCIQCGCEILGKTKADMGCDNEPFCYPDMMDAKTWAIYKKTHSIRLFD